MPGSEGVRGLEVNHLMQQAFKIWHPPMVSSYMCSLAGPGHLLVTLHV